jgi:hypothetical protein
VWVTLHKAAAHTRHVRLPPLTCRRPQWATPARDSADRGRPHHGEGHTRHRSDCLSKECRWLAGWQESDAWMAGAVVPPPPPHTHHHHQHRLLTHAAWPSCTDRRRRRLLPHRSQTRLLRALPRRLLLLAPRRRPRRPRGTCLCARARAHVCGAGGRASAPRSH